MAYQSNIPQATDQLSVSQGDILNNFAALSTFLNINHVDFASGDQGKHKWVTLTVLVSPYNGTSTGDLNFAVRLVDINAATTFRIYISSRTSAGAAAGQTGFQFLAIGY